MFKAKEENNKLNHQMIVLGIEKKEALEKATSLKNLGKKSRRADTLRTSRRTLDMLIQ